MKISAVRDPGPSRMYMGYNHTVPISGEPHDVQTEFIDGDPPKIVSHAFVSGRVVASHLLRVAPDDLEDERKVRELIKQQQMETIRQLLIADRERRLQEQDAQRPAVVRTNESAAEADTRRGAAKRKSLPLSAVSVIGPATTRLPDSPTEGGPVRFGPDEIGADQICTEDGGTESGSHAASAGATQRAAFSPEPAPPAGRSSLVFADADLRRALVRFARSVQELEGGGPLTQLVHLVQQSAPLLGRGFDGSRSEEAAQLLLVRADAIACIQSADAESAADLVEEFLRLARAFTDINHRAALQDHDHGEWTRQVDRLAACSADERPSDDEIRRLRTTWGRDARVDELLDDPGRLRNRDLRQALTAALDRLEAEMESP